MSAIAERFAELRRLKRGGFIPFIVAGHPDLETTAQLLPVLSQSGATVIELGVPFSDPTADGPIIQRAAQHALERGTDLPAIFKMLGRFSCGQLAPIVLFTYYNPLLQFGLEKFARVAEATHVAGVLVVDLPAELAVTLRKQLRARAIDLIFLVTPTTSDGRLKQIVRLGSGFIYAVARTGVTGTARELADESRQLIARTRAVTDLPIAVGFGITTKAQARRLCRYADAAVVGSRLVAEIESVTASKKFGRKEVLRAVADCARRFS